MNISKNAGNKRHSRGYRHELKYQITAPQLYELRDQLPDLMELDPSVGENTSYQIRSVYFDDYDDACFYENENGTDPREKFRIRIYNGSPDMIRLELKRKECGMTQKHSCRISRELAMTMIRGVPIPWDDTMHPLLKKFYIQQETRLLLPRIIVQYDRIPFVHPDGNVRVTLDLNIAASKDFERFFDADIGCRPIMPAGSELLEVKYDQFLPDYIYRSFQNRRLQQTTFSKYYLCRRFGELL